MRRAATPFSVDADVDMKAIAKVAVFVWLRDMQHFNWHSDIGILRALSSELCGVNLRLQQQQKK